jgi:hypothetical protein
MRIHNTETPLVTLDILGGENVATNNCVLRQNKTELLARTSYDLCHSMRDEMVVNRGYDLPPYYQTDWAFNKKPYWTPIALRGLESWFSPEYFHPETSDTTKCYEMENRSTNVASSGDALAKSPPAGMADFVTDPARHRGLAVLDANGGDCYDLENTTDWNVSTYDWFCTVMLHGPADASLDNVQTIAKKGVRFSFKHDWAGSNKHAEFSYSDGTNSGTLDLIGDSQMQSDRPTIYTFGRIRGSMFFRCIRHTALTINHEAEAGWGARDLDVATKPRLLAHSVPYAGDSPNYNGEFVELIFSKDSLNNETESQDAYKKVEGYLAHKYNVSKLLYQPDQMYYSDPPRI